MSLLKSVNTAVDAPEAVGIVKRQSFWPNLGSRDALVFGMSSQNYPSKAVPSDLSSLVLFLKTLVHERSGIQHVALRVEELEVLRHRGPGGHV